MYSILKTRLDSVTDAQFSELILRHFIIIICCLLNCTQLHPTNPNKQNDQASSLFKQEYNRLRYEYRNKYRLQQHRCN
jgi:hypothetical protein